MRSPGTCRPPRDHPSDDLKVWGVPVSAGYLSFCALLALLKEKDDYLLSLGALSTLSDMMPLKAITARSSV
jgi:hypothetical protein